MYLNLFHETLPSINLVIIQYDEGDDRENNNVTVWIMMFFSSFVQEDKSSMSRGMTVPQRNPLLRTGPIRLTSAASTC